MLLQRLSATFVASMHGPPGLKQGRAKGWKPVSYITTLLLPI